MPTIETSFGPVSYTDDGSGPPILLLHAAVHDRTDYGPVTEPLACGRRVLALDWPGHGESPLPSAPLPAAQFGDLLIEFADRLDLANAVIVGNSVGGLRRMPAGTRATRTRRGRRACQRGRLHSA